jgi:rod shape-determining protein MreB
VFNRWLDRFMGDLGVDLGTANTLVYLGGVGIVLREPSVIARSTETGDILSVGEEAKRMIGRTPANITATRPLRGGVIADFGTTAAMLSYFMRKATSNRMVRRPRVIVGVPSGATEVERRALIEAALQAGARSAYLIEEPMAAAIGAGLPVGEPVANTVIDIGGGRTQAAVAALGGIVTVRSIRVGGDEMDEEIIHHARRAYNLMIGERTAEEIKIEVGSACPGKWDELSVSVRGRDLVSGLPRTIRLMAPEVREAIDASIRAIVETVKQTLESAPPELSADVVERGIVLTGGGALLRGIDRLLTDETGMAVRLSDDPLSAVALGTGKALEEIDVLKRTAVASKTA